MRNAGLWLIILFSFSFQRKGNLTLSSPDNKIELSFNLTAAGEPQYQIWVNQEPFMAPSLLGLEIKESSNLKSGFKVVNVFRKKVKQPWEQPWGENKKMLDEHNEIKIQLQNKNKVNLTLWFRVFNDGVGFRYEYNVPKQKALHITRELTEFSFANEGIAWFIPANFETYELEYKKQNVRDIANANTPITFRFNNHLYASIHEAALTNFPEMTLKKNAPQSLSFQAALAPYPDGVKAIVSPDFITPWRTIQIANTAVGLINSGLILNLNEPSKIKDTEWIKPAKYIGIWWGMHLGIEGWSMGDRHGANTQNAIKYIDFASCNNIQSVLFEGWNQGWENWGGSQQFNYTLPYDDFDIKKIAKYAKQRKVQIIGHHETGGNIENYERQLDKSFSWYKSLGINTVKTGYAGGITGGQRHHGQYMVNHYRKVVETAAKYKIMLNVHEPIKPTGIRRTYPNMMTREGVRGMEWNAWSYGNNPTHTVILPFTRMLAGPLDYTPGIFDILYTTAKKSKHRKKWNDLDPGDTREHTTLAKQIANWVILYSPMQMASDLIEHYNHPAFQFFREYDADIDSSEALQGEPGEFVAIVRKAKDRIFLGATTNEQARTLKIPTTFLDKNKVYTATIYADGENADWQRNPTDYQISTVELTSADVLTIHMAPGGGQAIVFVPKK